ncbi:nitroreductase family protein [Rhodobacter calidifons]|uniref:Nitroreductase family protein n=1 Tax=Rhodobacter calidifons TaxID=2715277 RepID=A0ABX0G851_9RHOB|nr:nitroreductase family protein [Rhodobacter calidifons]NHB77462.1 nitroreductase family protein [Rhodobacter calidifons]
MSLDLTPDRNPDHPVAPQFPARWSPRSFTDRALTEAEVMSLLEAARWAPSASNHQPWRFIWALRGEAEFDAIRDSLTGINPVWAGKAGLLVVVASKDRVTNREGAEVANRTAGFDTGAAWMSLALQAQAMGLVSHAMGGFDGAKLAAAIGLPEGHTLHCVVAVGAQGPVADLPEELQAREKPNGRKPVVEIARHGRF